MLVKHSKLYTPVAGFAVTNEWDLLTQNGGSGWLFSKKAPIEYFELMAGSGWDAER